MKKLFFALLAIAFLGGCSSNSDNSANNIEALEKKLEESKSMDDANLVVEAYTLYINEHPDDTEQNAIYLYRAASTMFQMNRFSTATDYLKRSLKEFYPAKNNAKTAELLSVIYDEKLQSPSAATTIRQAMLSAFPDYENAAKIKEKLPTDLADMTTRMKDLSAKMFNDTTGKMNYRVANELVLNCELHALLLPNDPQSPSLLHKAAETARSIRVFPKALAIYEWIYTSFPNYEKAPQALFLHAFTLDNDLKKYEEAKKLYEEFLQKYPDNDFADDTQFLLENLGKSEEELIKSFEEKVGKK